jgi:glycosyltransferase involved in cell wall biosynthesis|tara:strand:- start:3540 stop:4190 length:651 start_codon:yes stop_codon:yes gene_type:complete
MISINILTYNRDVSTCLDAVKKNTNNINEVILVDNANNYKRSYDDYVDKYIGLKNNEWTYSRNYGKLVAKYDYIACIDDDVIVYPGWDEILLNIIQEDSNIAGVGPCGHYVYDNLSNYNKRNGLQGNYVDVLTGYCWMHRNIPEGILPDINWRSWHDETWVQLQMREKGYRFKMSPNNCDHISQRGEISEESWKDHDEKIKLIQDRFDIKNLGLEK